MWMALTGLKGQGGKKAESQPISNSLQESDRTDDIAGDGEWEEFPYKRQWGLFWLKDSLTGTTQFGPTCPFHRKKA